VTCTHVIINSSYSDSWLAFIFVCFWVFLKSISCLCQGRSMFSFDRCAFVVSKMIHFVLSGARDHLRGKVTDFLWCAEWRRCLCYLDSFVFCGSCLCVCNTLQMVELLLKLVTCDWGGCYHYRHCSSCVMWPLLVYVTQVLEFSDICELVFVCDNFTPKPGSSSIYFRLCIC